MRTLARGGFRVLGFVLAVLLTVLGTIGFFVFAQEGALDTAIVAVGMVCVGIVLGRRAVR